MTDSTIDQQILLKKAEHHDLAQRQAQHQQQSQQHLAMAQRLEFQRELLLADITKLEQQAKEKQQRDTEKKASKSK